MQYVDKAFLLSYNKDTIKKEDVYEKKNIGNAIIRLIGNEYKCVCVSK